MQKWIMNGATLANKTRSTEHTQYEPQETTYSNSEG